MAGRYEQSTCSRCGQRIWAHGGAPDVQNCRRCKLGLVLDVTCGICLDVATDSVAFALVSNESWNNERCEHRFCRGCLQTYIRCKLEDGAWNIRCPGVGCKYQLVDADVRKVFRQPLMAGPEPPRRPSTAAAAAAAEEDSLKAGRAVLERYRQLRAQDYGAHLRSVLLARSTCKCDGWDESGSTASAETQSLKSEQALPESRIEDSEEDVGFSGEGSEAFQDWALSACQACPTCQVIIRKETGCDQIVCRCGAGFCFGCGAPSHAQCLCKQKKERGPSLALWLQTHGQLGKL